MNDFLLIFIVVMGLTFRLTYLRHDPQAKVWHWGILPLILGFPVSWYFEWPGTLPLVVEGYLLGLFLVLLIDYLDMWPFSPTKPGADHRRGATVVRDIDVARRVRHQREKADLMIGKVPLPVAAEPYHVLLEGGTGSGKTSAAEQMLDGIRQRPDRAILADAGGLFLKRYFDPKRDRLLNPFDQRSLSWSPFAEMSGPWDADSLARSLLPDGEGSSREWHQYSQTLLAAILLRLWETDQATNGRLLYYATIARVEELRELVAGLPAASLVAEGNEKMLGSVRGILGSHIKCLTYLPAEAGRKAFSIQQWIQQSSDGWLFLPYRDDQLATLTHLIAAWLDISSRSILALAPSDERRIWLVADEVSALGRIQTLEDFLTRARKAGGCAILGLQAISQLRALYGRDQAQTLLSCLSTWLILRANDPETSDYMAKYLGEREVRRVNAGGSQSSSGPNASWSEQIAREPVVLASEIQLLDNRRGFLKLPGRYPVCRVEIPIPLKASSGHPAFVPMDRHTVICPPIFPVKPSQSGESVIEIPL